ncbi:MAG: hypothetical protein IJ313_04515 [Clostridia bacterium]|nr:hypothetical protein [Clostridia bacterium]
MAISNIMRDYLVRYQQTALRETGRRPMTFLREPMDEKLLLPGCPRAGYAFWQPVAWEKEVPFGREAHRFHESIREYLSLCQFLEVRFVLPVANAGSPLSFLYGRVFETCRSTDSRPPERAFEEALTAQCYEPDMPLSYCMAQTCDEKEALLLMVRADDGGVYVRYASMKARVLDLKLGLDRLLPKLQFVYQF